MGLARLLRQISYGAYFFVFMANIFCFGTTYATYKYMRGEWDDSYFW